MTRRASLLVVPAYLALALALTWPLMRDFRHAVPADSGALDALMQAYILGWDWKTLPVDPAHVFQAPGFFPEPRSLAFMDHLLGEAVLGWPVRAATGSIPIAQNFLVLVSFVATGWVTYRIARLLGVSRSGSWLAGFLFTFCGYRQSNFANVNQLQTQFVALGLFFGLRFLGKRRVRDLVLAIGTLVVQSYFGWYYFFQLIVVFALLLALAWIPRDSQASRMPWKPMLALGALAVLLILPGVWPYLEQQRAMPSFKRTLGYSALYSCDLLDYGRAHLESRVGHWMPWRMGSGAFWPGLVTVVLGVVGVRSLRRRPGAWRAPWGALGWVGVTGFALSLGPVLQVAGHRLWIPLPYALAYYVVPGFASMRAPSRFGQLAILALAVAAGRGLDALRESPAWRRRMAWVTPALFGVAIVESLSVPIAMVAIPDRASLPPVYAWLARQPGRFAILELPMPASEAVESDRDGVRQFWALEHGKRRADGVSGFSPPDHERFRRAMQEFPSDASLAAAFGRGVRYLVVRYADYEPAARGRMKAAVGEARALREVARFGDDVIYESRQWPGIAPGRGP